MTIDEINSSEWSYNIDADDIGAKPVKFTISPNDLEKKALSRRFGILAIENAIAELTVKRDSGNRIIHVHGHLKAHVEQSCIVTMETLEAFIDETFDGWFADPAQAVSFTKAKRERMNLKDKEEQPMLEEYEDPEPIINGKIDLGEFVTQYFSLSLDPYPRKAGLVPLENDESSEGIDINSYGNPFAALKDWKAKERKKDN